MTSDHKGGFTLIEVLVVLTIISILTATLVPVVARWVEHSKEQDTLKRLRAAYQATYGRLELADHGYLGDLGRLPGQNPDDPNVGFADELADGAWPKAGNVEGVGYGWRGPYAAPDLIIKDAWGEPIELLTGKQGRLRSKAGDRTAGTADDLFYPSLTASDPLPGGKATGRLVVVVLGPARSDAPYALVPVAYDTDGKLAVLVRASKASTPGAPTEPITWVNAVPPEPGKLHFEFKEAAELPQGFHLVEALGERFGLRGARYQELRGTTRAYVQAGSGVRLAAVYLREALPDPETK